MAAPNESPPRPGIPELSLLVGAALLGAPAARAAAPERTPALVEKGKASFSRNCVACHGAKGEGDGPAAKALKPRPRNLVAEPTRAAPHRASRCSPTASKGSGVIAYKHLPEEERWALAFYVEGLAGGAEVAGRLLLPVVAWRGNRRWRRRPAR